MFDIEQRAKHSNRAFLLREDRRALRNPVHAESSLDPIDDLLGVLGTEFVVIAPEPGRRWAITKNSP
jgi:hypothetical protein